MKNLFKKMMLVAVAAMAFVACSQDNDEINATVKKTDVVFNASIEDVTRAYFGDEQGTEGNKWFPSYWSGNENVTLVAYDANGTELAQAWGSIEAEGEQATQATIRATFQGELTGVTTVRAYVGSWGYSEPREPQFDQDQQMHQEGTVASNAHIMLAEAAWDGVETAIDLNFSHAVAYGRMQVKGFDGKTITKAVVTVDEAEYVVNVSNELDTKYIWFACAADEDISTLDVAVTCSNNRTYVKTIDMTLAANPLKFRTGEVSKFAVSGLTEKPADYIINLNKVSARTGNTITFQGDEENDQWNVIFNAGLTELVAGTYQGLNGTDWSSADALEFDCFNSNFNLAANPSPYGYYAQTSNEVINVSIEGGIYTIEAYWTAYVDGIKTVQLTYQGDLTVTKSTNCIVKGECNNPQMFALWLAEDQTALDNDEYAYLYFRVPSSVYSVLPEGTYQFVNADNGDFIVNGWSQMYYDGDNYNIQSATVTVQHLDAGYIIDAVVVDENDNEFSYYYEGTVESKNSWSLINNPPIPYKDITVEGAMATVTASYSEGYYYESYPEYSTGDSFSINFTTEQIDGVAYSGSITLQVPIGEDTAGIIPAQTYSLTSDTYKISGGYADSYNFTSASLTVGHTATGYTLALTAENEMKTEFILNFEGAIAKESEYNNFRNPGDATKLDTPSNLNVTVDGTSATVTWDAVANADSYLVELAGTEDSYEISASDTLTATFTGLEYESYYSINITARPEASSTLYKNSDVASRSFETGKDPNAQALVFTTAEYVMSGTDMIVTFSDGTNKLKLTYFAGGATSFAAGTYMLHSNFSGGYSTFNGGSMQSCVVTVTGAPGATQTFDFVLNDYVKDYEFRYVGEVTVGLPELYAYVWEEYNSTNGYLVLKIADAAWNYYELAFVTTGNYLEEKTYVIGTDILLSASTTGIESGTIEVSYDESTSNYSFMISFVYQGNTIEGKYSGWMNLSAPM